MQSKTTVLAAVAAIAITSVSAGWTNDRPPIFNLNGHGEEYEANLDLMVELPSHCTHHKTWSSEWIPLYCKEEVTRFNLDPADVETRDVFFSDCDAAWVICRHKDAVEPWEEITRVSFTRSLLPEDARE